MNLLTSSFDTTNALSGMYLWLIFGYLAGMLNCDLQRFLQSHPLWVHAFGLVAFFFLFTLLDSNNKVPVWMVWVKTVFIYLLFVLMTKSKWYFVIPVLALLMVDQSLKRDVNFRKNAGEDVSEYEKKIKKVSFIMNIIIITSIFVGMFHYMFIQYLDYKQDFSIYKFFFGVSRCKNMLATSNRS